LEVAPEASPARAVYYANRAAARLSLVRSSAAAQRGSVSVGANTRLRLRLRCAAQGRYPEAVEDCTAALEIDESYLKARPVARACLCRSASAHTRNRTNPDVSSRAFVCAQALLRRAAAYEKQGELEQLEKAVAGTLYADAAHACTRAHALTRPHLLRFIFSLCFRLHARHGALSWPRASRC
jgi:tetratricopeptide (TPR) repeat protein